MRASVLSIVEGVPAEIDLVASVEHGEIDPDTEGKLLATAWQRVESYTGHRWGSRAVEIIAEGPGLLEPPLVPFILTQAEVWRDEAWQAVTLPAAPMGFDLGAETYRLTGTAGVDEEAPEIVREAVFRLAAFNANLSDHIQRLAPTEVETTCENGDGQPVVERATRSAMTAARALQYSGAADLLRAYRRLGAA